MSPVDPHPRSVPVNVPRETGKFRTVCPEPVPKKDGDRGLVSTRGDRQYFTVSYRTLGFKVLLEIEDKGDSEELDVIVDTKSFVTP